MTKVPRFQSKGYRQSGTGVTLGTEGPTNDSQQLEPDDNGDGFGLFTELITHQKKFWFDKMETI